MVKIAIVPNVWTYYVIVSLRHIIFFYAPKLQKDVVIKNFFYFCLVIKKLKPMPKESLTREELTERLRAIADEEVEMPVLHGAMCYDPMAPNPVIMKCELCGSDIETDTWQENTVTSCKTTVKKMKKLKYDVKVEFLCEQCICKLGFKNKKIFSPGNVFFFKTKDDKKYHLAISNDEDDYNAVLAFLGNECAYSNSRDGIERLKDNLGVIKRMTGISIK